MDYSSVNVASDRSRQGHYYDTKPGPYDIWAIEFGYSPALDDPEAEAERLMRLHHDQRSLSLRLVTMQTICAAPVKRLTRV